MMSPSWPQGPFAGRSGSKQPPPPPLGGAAPPAPAAKTPRGNNDNFVRAVPQSQSHALSIRLLLFDSTIAEYRPHAVRLRYAALSVITQALQGVAQAVGAIVVAVLISPYHGDGKLALSSGDLRSTCAWAGWANAAALALAVVMLILYRPFVSRAAFAAEALPAWMQLWASVLIGVAASPRRATSSSSGGVGIVLALADAVSAASGLLQVAFAVAPALHDAAFS
jgi:hypothetical protein